MRRVLVQAGLDDVEVLVEYQLPLTSKRADVVLCGVHPTTRQPSYVVVELKQWSSASLLEDSVDLCVVPAYGGGRLHPGEQVRRYCGHPGFKGLERTCVVLAVNGFSAEARAKQMLYVGLSRARSQLVVVGRMDEIAPSGERGGVRSRLQDAEAWQPPLLS